MFDFLYTFNPTPVLISFGPITIYWYGLCIVLGILAAIAVSLKISPRYNIDGEKLIDLVLWLVIAGVLGARIYDVLLEIDYYLTHPGNILKIWQGGLAIHGAIIGGLLALWLFSKKEKLNAWLIADIIAPGLALGQAIGRWGNYFNQELFGRPTSASWGLPIMPANRPADYMAFNHFHPTFLYESLGNLVIFGVLTYLHFWNLKKQKDTSENNNKPLKTGLIASIYFILYSILRFGLEFVRIDKAPEFFGLRVPQIMSLLIIVIAGIMIYRITGNEGLKNKKDCVNINNSSQ